MSLHLAENLSKTSAGTTRLITASQPRLYFTFIELLTAIVVFTAESAHESCSSAHEIYSLVACIFHVRFLWASHRQNSRMVIILPNLQLLVDVMYKQRNRFTPMNLLELAASTIKSRPFTLTASFDSNLRMIHRVGQVFAISQNSEVSKLIASKVGTGSFHLNMSILYVHTSLKFKREKTRESRAATSTDVR